MQVSMTRDSFGRVVCTVRDAGSEAVVTAADAVTASLDLLAALQDAADLEYGECLWQEAAGEYKWMLRRRERMLTVAIMWSSGTLTGWQHVIRGDTDFDPFAEHLRTQLAGLPDLP